MDLFFEILEFIILSILIVIISKYVLVVVLRKLAEAMNLKPKTVGNIAGAATSVPELLTVSFSSIAGLIGTSIYNIISSNIINLVQYIFSIYINKNQSKLNNQALRIDLILVVITIVIPIIAIITKIQINLTLVPVFILLFILFYYINHNAHKVYLNKQEENLQNKINSEAKWIKGKKLIIVKYFIYLVIAGVGLYFIGDLLAKTLTSLCSIFKIPEIVLGVALGLITSIPELITFFESQKHYKKNEKSDLGVIEATNNLLTSNVSNLFIIQTIGILLFAIFE